MKTPAKNKNTNAEPIGRLGLIQELKDGRIAQVSLTESQSIALQEFVKNMSKTTPISLSPEVFDVVLKAKVKKMKA